MKARILLIIMGLVSLLKIQGQVMEVNIQQCRQKAVHQSPLQAQYDLLQQSMQLKKNNIGKRNLPDLKLSAQATYQSDVTKVDLNVPPQLNIDFPVPDKDQYKVALDINQVIYDGGTTAGLKELEDAEYEIQKEKLQLELYHLKERVNQIYFNILMLKKQGETLALLEETLNNKLKDLETARTYGTALTKDVNMLRSEVLQVRQQIRENEINLRTQLKILSDLTEEEYSTGTHFIMPQIDTVSGTEIRRHEYKLFSLNQNKLSESSSVAGKKLMPGMYGFGQAGYGKPGLNMLSDKFDVFYIVGARLQWKFWDWNHTKTERKILNLQQDILETQKQDLVKNIRTELMNKELEMQKYRELIQMDNEIIKIKSDIAAVSSSQLDNGVITSSVYIEDVNAVHKAKLQREIHLIQLTKAGIEFSAAKGDL